MKRIAIALFFVLIGCGTAWYMLAGKTYTFSFTQQQIEEKLAARFPIHKNHLLIFGVHYENPRVKLTDGSSEIAIGVDARADFRLTDKQLSGSADLTTRIAYDANTGSFILHDPRLTTLEFSAMPEENSEKVRNVANLLAAEEMSGIPIYKLRPKDVKTSIARLVLKDVTVRDGLLEIVIGI